MRLNACFSFVALLCVASAVRAADPIPQDASPALAPAVLTALKGLSSEDFSVRQKAQRQLEAALAQQAVALASENDAEGQARLSGVLEFDDGLIRWIQDFLKSSRDERDAQLQLISHPDVLPILSKIFSTQTSRRTEGIAELAKLDFPGVDLLLARMIDDEDRAVSVAAMEGVWDRKPTTPIVDALWRRAVEAGMSRNFHYITPTSPAISFRGRPLSGVSTGIVYSRGTDGDIAAEILIHFQTSQVNDKLIAFFRQAAETASRPDATNTQLMAYSIFYPSIRNAYTLLQSYKPAEAIPSLFSLATCRMVQHNEYSDQANKFYASNRTTALATLVMLTDQREEDYHLKQLDRGTAGTLWVCSSFEDEEAAVAKLRVWWIANGTKFTAVGD